MGKRRSRSAGFDMKQWRWSTIRGVAKTIEEGSGSSKKKGQSQMRLPFFRLSWLRSELTDPADRQKR